jgi:hypothetical protein
MTRTHLGINNIRSRYLPIGIDIQPEINIRGNLAALDLDINDIRGRYLAVASCVNASASANGISLNSYEA